MTNISQMRYVVLDTNCLIHRESFFRFHLLSDIDKDDDKFVDCAITANADYIVTEDSHFNHLKSIPFPQLKVLTLDEFNDSL